MERRQPDETLEKLSRGIEESRRTAQRQAMELAQEYFGDSVEALKQQMGESRSRLESLPEEISGGQDETFQALFGELMESYSRLENCLDEAEKNVAGMDLERLDHPEGISDATRPREFEGTDAAHREAQRRGVDLDEVGGSGAGGRVVAEDVRSDEERQTGRPEATDAARSEAQRRGVDLSEVEATGAEGQIIISDVVEFAESAANVSGRAAATGAQEGATDAARRKAEELGVRLSDVTGTGSDGQITISDVTGVAEDDRGAVGQSSKQTGGAPYSEGERSQEAARWTDASGEPLATKAARRRADKLGVDLSRIQGSGTRGLITIEDVLEARNG